MRMKPGCASQANGTGCISTAPAFSPIWPGMPGRQALQDIGIWPRFRGRAMGDRWASYDHYQCAQSICGAHLVRDGVYVCEQDQQAWAEEMADLRLRMAKAADEWRE